MHNKSQLKVILQQDICWNINLIFYLFTLLSITCKGNRGETGVEIYLQ